jgi:vang-like
MAGFLSIIAFLSPILMLSLPKMNVIEFKESQLICNVECDGLLLNFSFKLIILALGTLALFFRPSKVRVIIMPDSNII